MGISFIYFYLFDNYEGDLPIFHVDCNRIHSHLAQLDRNTSTHLFLQEPAQWLVLILYYSTV